MQGRGGAIPGSRGHARQGWGHVWWQGVLQGRGGPYLVAGVCAKQGWGHILRQGGVQGRGGAIPGGRASCRAGVGPGSI